jgi:hypothetical protein
VIPLFGRRAAALKALGQPKYGLNDEPITLAPSERLAPNENRRFPTSAATLGWQISVVSALASALLISSSAIRHLIWCLIAIVEGSLSFRPNRWAFILGGLA